MHSLALLDAGMGRFVMFMGLPFLVGFIAVAAFVIEKTVDIIRDEIYDSNNAKAKSNVEKEEKKDEEPLDKRT